MKARPILMSAPMVRALLAGTKTQTRRLMKPQPNRGPTGRMNWGDALTGRPFWHNWHESYNSDLPDGVLARCPYGQPGAQLWVRETWALTPRTAYWHDPTIPHRESPDGHSWAVYREGWERCQPGQWKSPIFMPRWASRLTLAVTEVRVQRLQDISGADVRSEGLEPDWLPGSGPDGRSTRSAVEAVTSHWDPANAYAALWDTLHKQPGTRWADNPWVFAVTFSRVEEQG